MQEQSTTDNLPQVTKKPWHKTWWGYVLQFFFWPVTITYYVWKQDKWDKKYKIIGLSIFWITLFGAGQVSDSTTPQTAPAQNQVVIAQKENKEPEKKVSDEDLKKQHQEAVKKFEADLYANEKGASEAFKAFKEASANFSTNGKTTFELYELAKKAKSESETAMMSYSRMKAPEDLPKEVQKHLEESARNMGISYSTKSDSLELAMQYFEEEKLSALSEYKEKMNSADILMMKAVTELMKARELVGLVGFEGELNSQ